MEFDKKIPIFQWILYIQCFETDKFPRNQDFNELNAYMQHVKKIYAIGSVTDRLADYAKGINIPCEKCYNLRDAMSQIVKNVQNGEVVLLSPGSSSQDQYVKFEDRGDEFKNIVEKI